MSHCQIAIQIPKKTLSLFLFEATNPSKQNFIFTSINVNLGNKDLQLYLTDQPFTNRSKCLVHIDRIPDTSSKASIHLTEVESRTVTLSGEIDNIEIRHSSVDMIICRTATIKNVNVFNTNLDNCTVYKSNITNLALRDHPNRSSYATNILFDNYSGDTITIEGVSLAIVEAINSFKIAKIDLNSVHLGRTSFDHSILQNLSFLHMQNITFIHIPSFLSQPQLWPKSQKLQKENCSYWHYSCEELKSAYLDRGMYESYMEFDALSQTYRKMGFRRSDWVTLTFLEAFSISSDFGHNLGKIIFSLLALYAIGTIFFSIFLHFFGAEYFNHSLIFDSLWKGFRVSTAGMFPFLYRHEVHLPHAIDMLLIAQKLASTVLIFLFSISLRRKAKIR